MENDFSALYSQFKEILETGTEEEAEKFLTDHINEFPEDVRKGVALALFENGLNETAANQTAAHDFQQEGIDAVYELEKGKRMLDDKLRVLNLQEKI